MSILKVAARVFMRQMGLSSKDVNLFKVVEALKGVYPLAENDVDLPALVVKISESDGMVVPLRFWLESRENEKIHPERLCLAFDPTAVQGFAATLGLDYVDASTALVETTAAIIDNCSHKGCLHDFAPLRVAERYMAGAI